MPGKHVHFSPLSYSTSDTPSPSFSTSTLSSEDVDTPPHLGFGSPYRVIPLPGIEVTLHSILMPHRTPFIMYDLTLTPETMKPLVHPFPSNIWEQPASQPPIPHLEIACPSLPWRITALPRSKHATYVSVGDVFAAIYRSLRTNVTEKEFNLVPTADLQKTINIAFHTRCKRQPSSALYDAEKGKGLKRIDFLGHNIRFMGLSPVKGGTGGWILLVA